MKGRYDIVAAITRAIALRLQDAVNQAGGGLPQTLVTTKRPGSSESGAQPQINVYLFHVLPNPYLRNLHEPWRVQGRQVDQPTTALDLFYLLSFSGAEETDKLEPQQLLGISVNALNVNAIITPSDLQSAQADVDIATVATVQLTPHSMGVEEMSRLWGMFPQAPYQLSVCYRASAALVMADVDLQPSPPTTGAATTTTTGAPPRIDGVVCVDGGPPVYGSEMTLTGSGMSGSSTLIFVDEAQIAPSAVTPTSLTFTLRGRGLRAGDCDIVVVRDGVVSDAANLQFGPLVKSLTPSVKHSQDGWGGDVEIELTPAVQPGQSVELDLFSVGQPGYSRGFRAAVAPSAKQSSKFSVPVQGLASGKYAVWVKVDGVANRLQRDASGAYSGPFLQIGKGG